MCVYSCCLVAKLCLTLFDTMDCSLPGSSIHWISQTRRLEWVATSFSGVSYQPGDQTLVSYVAHVSCIAGQFFTTQPPGKPIHTYIHTCILVCVCVCVYSFFIFCSIIRYYKILSIVPVLYVYSRSLMVIYYIYSSMYILIPNS